MVGISGLSALPREGLSKHSAQPLARCCEARAECADEAVRHGKQLGACMLLEGLPTKKLGEVLVVSMEEKLEGIFRLGVQAPPPHARLPSSTLRLSSRPAASLVLLSSTTALPRAAPSAARLLLLPARHLHASSGTTRLVTICVTVHPATPWPSAVESCTMRVLASDLSDL